MPKHDLPSGLIVWGVDEEDSESEKLAQRLGAKLVNSEEPPDGAEWILFYEDEALYLFSPGHPDFKPITIDFLSGDFARRWKSASRNDMLAKAVGLKKGTRTILDATCGFGYDAFFLATFPNVEVYACERHPVAAELAMNALLRVKEMGRFEEFPLYFHFGDSIDFMNAPNTPDFDAIFLDPMYPREDSKSAKQKKEMQLYRELVGKDMDAADLFAAAWAKAKKRVVVKRPDDAPKMAVGREPDFSLEGKTVRYDIYLKNP
ncbi:MAG: class I SAM-dependent methyltransferase [Bdellovibrionota bacterium]